MEDSNNNVRPFSVFFYTFYISENAKKNTKQGSNVNNVQKKDTPCHHLENLPCVVIQPFYKIQLFANPSSTLM